MKKRCDFFFVRNGRNYIIFLIINQEIYFLVIYPRRADGAHEAGHPAALLVGAEEHRDLDEGL